MKKQFKIIETENYILAVSDEKIEKDNYFYYTWFDADIIQKADLGSNLNNLNAKNPKDNFKKIIAYQPKNNAKELDGLPLLPEIIVEDDAEKLAKEKSKEIFGNDFSLAALSYQTIFKDVYQAATKVYSEEDLLKAFEAGMYFVGEDKGSYEELIQSLKQPKTPEWFVAEMEQVILKDPNSCEHYIEVGCIKDICTCYTFRLKTTTINNKTYLVGNYE
jgi:hypothetical protein